MFGTHQARLPRELALLGITDMEAANRYLREHYIPAFNAEFMQPAMEEGSACVPHVGRDLDDVLCEQFERTVGKDNCVSFESLELQIPADRVRHHYVKVQVRVIRQSINAWRYSTVRACWPGMDRMGPSKNTSFGCCVTARLA